MSTKVHNQPRPTGKNRRATVTIQPNAPPANSRLHLDSAKVRGLIKAEMKEARRQHTGVTKSAKALLANMALPSDAKAVRVASASGSDPTALANLRARETVRFPRATTPVTTGVEFITQMMTSTPVVTAVLVMPGFALKLHTVVTPLFLLSRWWCGSTFTFPSTYHSGGEGNYE